MHLSSAAFIDLLDGTTAESTVPHLATCTACREQLAELRRMQAGVDDVDVPEPSPLFWDHLSARVREAVAAESIRAPWWGRGWWRPAAIAGTAALVLLFAVAPRLFHRLPAAGSVAYEQGQSSPVSSQPMASAAGRKGVDDASSDDSLQFVTDLAGDVDWDAALDAGLVSPGTAEVALAQMESSERVELERLLKDALTRGGA